MGIARRSPFDLFGTVRWNLFRRRRARRGGRLSGWALRLRRGSRRAGAD